MKYNSLFLLFFLCLNSLTAKPVPRTVATLYDSKEFNDSYLTPAHQVLEMPLNHLGFNLEFFDLQQGLPDLSKRDDIAGIITWFTKPISAVPHDKYVEWAIKMIEHNKKLAIFGNPGFYADESTNPEHMYNWLWNKLGLVAFDDYVEWTNNSKVVNIDLNITNFETQLPAIKPSYSVIQVYNKNSTPHLTVRSDNGLDFESVLIATNPKGGYVAAGYDLIEIEYEGLFFRKWFLNPFTFLKTIFDSEQIPKPDTTTIAGRRIYYAQINGDGWNSPTEIIKFRHKLNSTEVIYQEILQLTEDLPITVAPIVAELDQEWTGTEKSREIAQKIFQLPQVAKGSHTLSHPLDWGYFENYSSKAEKPYSVKETVKHWKKSPHLWERIKYYLFRPFVTGTEQKDSTNSALQKGYVVPRSFFSKPFDLKSEIFGSIEWLNAFPPTDKHVQVYCWSGNSLPGARAIALTREAGVTNNGGGDTRFDNLYPSYSWVCPLGRSVGDQYQVYASCSNEYTYTNGWTDNFYAFNQLPVTFMNTEKPIRVKPINLYFHMYSGSKNSSLTALKQNISYIRTQEIAPITTAQFSAGVDGFRSTKLTKLNENQWQVSERGALQTIRIDSDDVSVDISASKGIVGQRYSNQSLYIYLDEAESTPLITLKQNTTPRKEPTANTPYLIESRWRIWKVANTNTVTTAISQGYGKGEMTWKVPSAGTYTMTVTFPSGISFSDIKKSNANNEVSFDLDASALEPLSLKLEKN